MNRKKNTPVELLHDPLDVLFNSSNDNNTSVPSQYAIQFCRIDSIVLSPSQPRRYFAPDKLEELAESIREVGLLQPLVVRLIGDTEEQYELIAGERRLKACQILEFVEVPVYIINLSDRDVTIARLVENLQRENLNAFEETLGILDLLSTSLDLTRQQIILHLNRMRYAEDRIGHNVVSSQNKIHNSNKHNVVSEAETSIQKAIEQIFEKLGRMNWESFVKHRLPILKLPEDIQESLSGGKIEYTKAVAIARIKDKETRVEILNKAISEELSLSEIKSLVSSFAEPKSVTGKNTEKERAKKIYETLKTSSVWNDKKKLQKISKLLDKMEEILLEN